MLTRPLSWCPAWETTWKFKANTPFFSTTKIQILSKISQTFPNIQISGWGEDDSGHIVPHQKKGLCLDAAGSQLHPGFGFDHLELQRSRWKVKDDNEVKENKDFRF